MNPGDTDPLMMPLSIRDVTFRNRIMSTSHACGLEEGPGIPGETYQRYHEEKARGGIGLTMFGGSAYVSEDSTWPSGQLDMSNDRIIPCLQSFSERIHRAGAGIMMQLTHLGRRGEWNSQNWLSTIGPSPVRETLHRSIPREMDRDDIRRVMRNFGEAAHRAREGGLDGMETMVGGHLIGQFLSPATNHRTDEFGGSVENRCRFGLMVHEEIRRKVGDDFLVGMRFPVDEAMQDGSDFEDCLHMAGVFERSGLIDFFNANYGRIDTELRMVTDCMPAMGSPAAPWLEIAGRFKREVNLPVFHAARIVDLATARHAIREGLLDMVAMTRAHIADPHIVNKILRGEEDRIRPCVGMTHCMGDNRPTCAHNPAAARERHWPQLIRKNPSGTTRAVVVGAGPAGLEAARILAERGHSVKILEAASKPGGQLRLAVASSWRRDVAGIIDWRLSELDRLGVELCTNRLAEISDVLSEEPGIVILATGGVPDVGGIDGARWVTSAWDVLGGAARPADSVIVYDGTGRHPALTTAEYCHDRGSRVQAVLIDDRPGAELGYAERAIWKRELARRDIVPVAEHRLIRVKRSAGRLTAVFACELTSRIREMTAEQVIADCGTVPVEDLYRELRGASSNDGITDIPALLAGRPQPGVAGSYQLHRIGDAQSSRNLAAAMFDALRLCSVM
ncbi:MAG: NADH:flavin oxidoreductase [Gammaproteobacteria bacterium]|nr:NADH:flavin oxidoreductase [Gammaproteobacteria bacterium]MYD77063.1 NADH:flavin oxidoreductase [Gammaproteobacteria bacterium]MYJ52240.1 NADH:flavin oxidoreductase [Gammaproteobacteria bacterium]